MDELTSYRLDQGDKRMDALQAQLGTIQATLADMRVDMAKQAGEIRNDLSSKASKGTIWAAAGVLAGVVVAVGALFWSAAGNQLSAFQAGLSAVQTGLAVHQAVPAPPPASTPSPNRP